MKRVAAIVFPFLLAACATGTDVIPPTVQLSNLRVVSAGPMNQQLSIEIRIGNPNDFAIPLNGLSFDLDVNGEPFAEGLSDESVTVPRLGYATVSAKATTNTLNLIRQLMALGSSDRIAYRLHGRAYIGGVTGNTRYPFDRRGELALPTAPRREEPGGVRTFVPSV